MLNAAVAGLGLAYMPDGTVQPHLAPRVVSGGSARSGAPSSGDQLHDPGRPQSSAAFALLVDALRLPGRLGLLMQLAAPHQPTGDIGRLERRAFGR